MQLDTEKHKNDATEKLINSKKLCTTEIGYKKKRFTFFLHINVASSFGIATQASGLLDTLPPEIHKL